MSVADLIANLFILGIVAILIASMWKIFEKADKPGWASLIPIYNTYVIIKIAGRPGWWLALFIIPIANIIAPLIIYWDVAKRFGKGDGFAIATALFPMFTFPILAFGDATYTPKDEQPTQAPPAEDAAPDEA